jgi:hypothetical protein
MRKNTLIILLFIFLASILYTCKKYPDGPVLSLRGKISRVTGTYDVESFKVNNIDSTSILLCKTYSFSHGHGSSDIGSCCSGFWYLTDDNSKITISIFSGDIGPFIKIGKISWKILRLTNTEFWIETKYVNSYYEVKLKKVGSA